MNIIIYLTFLLSYFLLGNSDLIVQTKLGKVKGLEKKLDDEKIVNVYYGIPYAKPPIGELRFKKPLPPLPWKGTYDATKIRYSCIQRGSQELPRNEDCLTLSVWQPENALKNNTKLPVMFWIHGGGYQGGSMYSGNHDGRYIASLGNVILVSINYRLGALGFLYSGTNDAPGNVGLHDQVSALEWTKDNIEYFGGDPNSITIFGQSAGGSSVGALILSPIAKGLFQKAILQSGSPLSFVLQESSEKALISFKYISQKLNCTHTLVKETVACLRNVDPSSVLEASKSTLLENFLPIYGDEFMPIKSSIALKNGKFNQNLSVIVGTVKDEGSIYAVDLFKNLSPDVKFNMTLKLTKSYIQVVFFLINETFGPDVANFYTKSLTDNDQVKFRKAVASAIGDYFLTCPTILFGQQYAKFSKFNHVYAYRVSHPPGNKAGNRCKGWMGVCHSDDVVFLFGFPIKFRGIYFSEQDYEMSRNMIASWTSFAKNGVPTLLHHNSRWKEVFDHSSHVNVMDLNPNHFIMDTFHKDTCEEFWRKYLLAKSELLVNTKLGTVKGLVKNLDDGKIVNVYYGIQYAKPPIGDLRFKKPIPVSPWNGIYDATKIKYACMQRGFKEAPKSEDCLYLSVWQPESALKNNTKLPVMFWIHGGGFSGGSGFSGAYDGRYVASLGNVILVTINYRLGPFGFLYSGTNDAPGNVGLHDQLTALKWTKDNIEYFGGDPNSITIFGQSAGGSSVGFLILSPLAKGLFHKAIIQSGAFFSHITSIPPQTGLTSFKVFAEEFRSMVKQELAF